MIFEELAGLVYVSPQYAGQKLIGAEIEAPSKFNTSISIPSSVISRCIEIDEKFLVSAAPPVVAGVGLDFVIAEVESYEALKKARCNISAFEKADKDYSYGDDFFSLMIFTNNEQNKIVARVFAPFLVLLRMQQLEVLVVHLVLCLHLEIICKLEKSILK